jgi:hypothetical protein
VAPHAMHPVRHSRSQAVSFAAARVAAQGQALLLQVRAATLPACSAVLSPHCSPLRRAPPACVCTALWQLPASGTLLPRVAPNAGGHGSPMPFRCWRSARLTCVCPIHSKLGLMVRHSTLAMAPLTHFPPVLHIFAAPPIQALYAWATQSACPSFSLPCSCLPDCLCLPAACSLSCLLRARP